MTPSWNPDLVAAMVKAGWSAGVIGVAFGLNRQQAQRRMRRDHITAAQKKPLRRSSVSPAAIVTGDWGNWEEREANQSRILPPFKPKAPRPKSMRRLKPGECRWPVKDAPRITGGYLFCAQAVESGSSYCARHKAKARPR
jgi:hypothetical protein